MILALLMTLSGSMNNSGILLEFFCFFIENLEPKKVCLLAYECIIVFPKPFG
ncbi:hypothetical protein J2Y03_001073 [Neobacillus niacini]|nr:hypothetical protein [Neobacillus niacini]